MTLRTCLITACCIPLMLSSARAADETGSAWRARISSADSGMYTTDDITEEVKFGREVAARVLGKHPLVKDKPLQRYLSLVGGTLARATARPELQFRFAVIDSSLVNAYSTPGGYIFVTSGALALMKNEAELAGVLAHEIAHVCERHVVRELNLRGRDSSGVTSVMAIIGGATDAARIAFTQAVDQALDILFKDGYKQEDEMRADEDAVYYTAMAGYDPAALETYLQRVAALNIKVGKSYPQYDTRLALIRKASAEQGLPPGGVGLGEDRFAATVKGQR